MARNYRTWADRDAAQAQAEELQSERNKGHTYNYQAVAREIQRDRRISAGEARLIHGLLRGRS